MNRCDVKSLQFHPFASVLVEFAAAYFSIPFVSIQTYNHEIFDVMIFPIDDDISDPFQFVPKLLLDDEYLDNDHFYCKHYKNNI